ncbi:MAG TPA: patatin-like phospholipase family protein, partial [Acidimicrobiales bacterium]|nr:patatin-like phospholipase family protein [Acidimicrobiales bacterium]
PDRALWITAVARNTGRRVVFGRSGPGAVSADPAPAEAVAASCAIPGVFAPVVIGGVEYVDGGVHAPTNADLAAGLGLDLVVVSSPMSAARPLRPGLDLPGRQLSRITLAGEVSAVRRSGTPVLAFQPTPADRTVMGLNAMDRSRREAVTAQARESTLRRLDRPDVKQRLAALLTG